MRLTGIFIILVLGACKQKPSQKPVKEEESRDTLSFFQVNEYIQSEIKEVTETPYFIYKRTTNNGKIDSVAIDSKIFTELSKPFLEIDINDPAIKKNYNENVFHDQTTKSYTLSYTTADKTLPVQSVDVLLKEDAQSVKRIFIRRFFDYGDSSALEQLNWKSNERFQVSRLVQYKSSKEKATDLTVVWNNKEL